MKILPLFCVGTGLVFCAACSIFPEPEQTETFYYDLTVPKQIALPKPVEIIPFSSVTGERFRMACREKENIVRANEFHKWVQTPGSMLTKYLRLAFRNEPGDIGKSAPDSLLISGTVLLFEMRDGYAELAVRYQIQYGAKDKINKTIMIREKLAGSTPTQFAEAMSKTAERFALLLARESATLVHPEAAEKK
ncbi:MAG: hypothetical protein BWY31_01628 [Lentisphaerae bacterium ADurb.Bin242]|nr:MAG: hypothetical protein BWY31_01628 [Lentisphaerae bacterium ADurb.Bin242]